MPDYKEMYLIMVRAAEQAQNILIEASKSARRCTWTPRTTRTDPRHANFFGFPDSFPTFFRLFLLYSRKRRRFA